MAVDDALWWSVWWPWMVVWGITAIALVVAVCAVVLAWRARRRAAGRRAVPEMIFYLDERLAAELYEFGGYGDRFEREVEERRQSGGEGRIRVLGGPAEVEGSHTKAFEQIRRYIATASPVTVTGELLAALDAADGVVRVDLTEGTVVRDDALAKALPDGRIGSPRLTQLNSYVSLGGIFRGDGAVFHARIGPADGAGPVARVRVECAPDGLRTPVPGTAFQARCLGRVHGWEDGTGELVVRPLAIFQ